ncbi:hypothetical protein Dip518_001238 [Parelusimicrobium proximum]|uniref:hypothetical protein n=1 Tax=Parelusimicrobium proximum TaxID=3228953 RepID=UPI003D178E1F
MKKIFMTFIIAMLLIVLVFVLLLTCYDFEKSFNMACNFAMAISSVAVLFIAVVALSSWKNEYFGREQIALAKEMNFKVGEIFSSLRKEYITFLAEVLTKKNYDRLVSSSEMAIRRMEDFNTTEVLAFLGDRVYLELRDLISKIDFLNLIFVGAGYEEFKNKKNHEQIIDKFEEIFASMKRLSTMTGRYIQNINYLDTKEEISFRKSEEKKKQESFEKTKALWEKAKAKHLKEDK